MKLFKNTLPFSALALFFLILGVFTSDPRHFSFGAVWLLIAAAKYILGNSKEKAKRTN